MESYREKTAINCVKERASGVCSQALTLLLKTQLRLLKEKKIMIIKGK